jgi:hypothetical protein
VKMAKKRAKKEQSGLLGAIMWIVGVLVTLSIGFSMIAGELILPSWLGGAITAMVVGWIVVIGAILGVIMAIIRAAA